MSSSTETTSPAPRMQITTDTSPPPPWAGVKFICDGEVVYLGEPAKCGGSFQLEAADKCYQIEGTLNFTTPACFDCGHHNVVAVDRESLNRWLEWKEAQHGGS